jgi:hypothetical protein
MKSRPKVILEEILHKGESAIDDFIIDREAETLFLDFKRSADNGGGKKLHQNDRTNLARAISGFGNSEGGIIVWGVDCREDEDYADVAQAKFPLIDPQRYRSWLESAVSASTIPPHSEVEHHVILSENGKEGYVITYIPKSNHAPHQVISSGKGHFHYFFCSFFYFQYSNRPSHNIRLDKDVRKRPPHTCQPGRYVFSNKRSHK